MKWCLEYHKKEWDNGGLPPDDPSLKEMWARGDDQNWEELSYYDGEMIGAFVVADTLEQAIERAKKLHEKELLKPKYCNVKF
jgi:hypothetical protein